MSKTLTEQKVLKKLGIPDFRHMTKDKVVRFASMLPKMNPEVAKKALEQFPEFAASTKEIVSYDFYGGNLAGIQEKLPYLKDLGISVIYLNPIFESASNHHYDTGDYHKVDPILGTNEELKELCAKAKEMGIRIMLDGVFSHTGDDSRYFNKYGHYDTVGAYQSKDSPYYEWYCFNKYPESYESWWGFSTLPNVKEETPSYMNFIINDEDSVLKYWMKQGISG